MDGGFVLKTANTEYQARSILLAIGRRGSPNKLGVPGEELAKVVYRLSDPEQYRGQHVLVVGGGNAAIEAAVTIAAEPDTHVTLSYRNDSFGRVTESNRTQLQQAQAQGQLTLALRTQVAQIEPRHVSLDGDDGPLVIENDVVIVCAGGVLPTPMLIELGIGVETKYGTV